MYKRRNEVPPFSLRGFAGTGYAIRYEIFRGECPQPHIDRLVEIFSACWPMYAAMPAVLKDAIERSYQNAGWDLRESESDRGVFPTFFDLQRVLPTVIEESHYSNDTQSDYVGALCTRVKSLTNGIYGSVFCAEDALSDAELFDENVVVDLSRASAMETKSLLMGILVMKLQEYRMCSGVMNGKLRHVTVLEEAHNLLRKTSAEQSQESANVQGKSVEMLANAIAEMRTYGEGFIIADQAPGLLDVSVIRNTNTKIILRLPDEEDRKLVGKSAGLKEAQIDELSKLPLGVAAVYQNEWPEAVLCKVKAYPVPEGAVYHKPVKTEEEINTEFIFGQLAQEAPAKCLNDSETEQLKRWLPEEVTEIISRAGAFDFEQAEEESEQVIFIKLAERLHNLRTMEFMDGAEWKKRAEETIKLFLPMAKRIGNKKLTDELCSLSMKYL